jgi:tetratricopeptide (TPR) repeat protein
MCERRNVVSDNRRILYVCLIACAVIAILCGCATVPPAQRDFDNAMAAGDGAARQGKLDDALGSYKQAESIAEKNFGAESTQAAQACQAILFAYEDKKDYGNALAYAEKALVLARKLFPKESFEAANGLYNAGRISVLKGDYDKGLSYLTEGITQELSKKGNANAGLVYSESYYRGKAFLGKGDFQKAANDITVALTWYDLLVKAKKAEEAGSAEMRFDLGKAWLNESLSLYLKQGSEKNFEVGMTYEHIGFAYYYQADLGKAIDNTEKALSVFLKFMKPESPTLGSIYNNLAVYCAAKGDAVKTAEYKTKAAKAKASK